MSEPGEMTLDFKTAEEKFYALMGRLAAGVIDQDEFRARLEELIVRDEAGQTWMIGAQSGRWYRYDGKRWVQDTPPKMRRGSPLAETRIAAAPPPPVSEADLHPPSEQRCPRCDHALIAGATFCDRCGLRLPGDTAVYSAAELTELQTEPCPKCGRPLPVAAPFCAGCGYRRPRPAAPPPPPPVTAREPFAVPPPPPPRPPIAAAPARPRWLNWLVVGLVGLLIVCCLATVALALFWPGSPVGLMNLLGGPAGPSPTLEPTQTITYIIATPTEGGSPTTAPPTVPATPTATQPPPTRARTPAATTVVTPPPLPTVTRAPTQPPASPTSAVLRFRLKETRLVEEKIGVNILEVIVLDKNGRGIPGINVRIDGGDPASWNYPMTTDSKGRCGNYALSANIYNVTLVDYGMVAPGIDCRGKHWEVIFEAY